MTCFASWHAVFVVATIVNFTVVALALLVLEPMRASAIDHRGGIAKTSGPPFFGRVSENCPIEPIASPLEFGNVQLSASRGMINVMRPLKVSPD